MKSLPPEVVGSRQEQDLREHHDAVHRQHYGNDVFSCSIPQPDSTAQLQQSRLPPEIATKGDDTSLDRAHPDIPADTVPRLEESSLAETNAAGTGDPQGVIQYGGKHTYAESELLNGGVLRYRTRSDYVQNGRFARSCCCSVPSVLDSFLVRYSSDTACSETVR